MLLPISPPSNLHRDDDNLWVPQRLSAPRSSLVAVITIIPNHTTHSPTSAAIVDKVITPDVMCCSVMAIVTTMDKSQYPIHSPFILSPQSPPMATQCGVGHGVMSFSLYIPSQSSQQWFGNGDSRRSRSLPKEHGVIIKTEEERECRTYH